MRLWTDHVDAIFVIALPKRINDRLSIISKSLNKENIGFVVWEAEENQDGKKGLILTMQSLLTFCLSMQFSFVLILEDDAKLLIENAEEIFNNVLSQLPEDFDLCYLGCNLFQKDVELYSQNLIKVTGAAATHSIVYSRKGIEKAINVLKDADKNSVIVPVDMLYVKKIQVDGNCFTSFPMFFSQQDGYSDIEKREISYSKFLDKRFNEKTKHLL